MKTALVLTLLLIALMLGAAGGFVAGELNLAKNRTILVAAEGLAMGTIISDPDRMFRRRELRSNEIPDGAIADWRDLKGKELLRSLDQDTPCTWYDLSNSRTALSRSVFDLLDQDKVIIRVRIEVDFALGGAILPGSKVDLLEIISNPDETPTEQVLVENAIILAFNPLMGPPPDKRPFNLAVLVVAIDPHAVGKLVEAQSKRVIVMRFRRSG